MWVISVETTFEQDLTDMSEMLDHLRQLSEKVLSKMNARQSAGSTITLKVKYKILRQLLGR